MKKSNFNKSRGYSLIELLIAMAITLILLGLATTLFARALGTRTSESRKTDALTSARAALNIISREISNSGYGLTTNGIVTADSNTGRIHFRSNLFNNNNCVTENGEDVTYFFDAINQSIVRYVRYASTPCGTAFTTTNSVVVNRISNVTFSYFDYVGSSSAPTETSTPTANTGRVRITVTVQLEDVQGQPDNQTVTFTSDVTLRNSPYMLNQY
jgi:prepilin-type N-terminal cleavage/methylation domain-containing protein